MKHAQKSVFVTALLWLALMLPLSGAHAAGTYDADSPAPKTEAKPAHKSYNLARKHLGNDAYEDALAALAIVRSDEPDNADAWNLTGYANRKLGRYAQSEAAYSRALSLNPKHTRAMEYMGELYLTLGDLPKAQALLNQLNSLCRYNCKDRDMLKKAIAAYQAK